MSLLGWRQWAVDGQGQLRPAWTPWSPFPPGMLLWRADGITQARCLRTKRPDSVAAGEPPPAHHRVPDDHRRPHERRLPDEQRVPDDHRVPDEHCLCGLYAWRTPEILAAARRPRWTALPCVVGVVRLGGRIIIGERGYRAERGYPVAVLDRHGVVSTSYAVARYRTFSALVAEWTPSGSEATGIDQIAG
ncbi:MULTISPECIES: hypothetical protein [Frankia]|uniref:Uncharacterized protein n=1 Tax=Frankia alni (strain DSM 45986 / CECT 9034 / ACN14a) TaxID=326424 RepID=Q0RSN1_FRAAA|nr:MULTISPECIES: hypothetical protein [Frankia]CAJ59428.1 hypothetical protein FRAAL0758 [Frankia alni ACN14a]